MDLVGFGLYVPLHWLRLLGYCAICVGSRTRLNFTRLDVYTFGYVYTVRLLRLVYVPRVPAHVYGYVYVTLVAHPHTRLRLRVDLRIYAFTFVWLRGCYGLLPFGSRYIPIAIYFTTHFTVRAHPHSPIC